MTGLARLVPAALLAAVLLAAPAADAAPKRVPFQRSITIAEWGSSGYEPARTAATLRRLKRRQHVDTVTLIVVWMQHDETSVNVQRGDRTVLDRHLRAAIRAARRLGLRVVLRPYVDRDDDGWRGELRPASVDDWFASYGRFIRHYARLAQRERVRGFVVGSELATLSDEEEHWRALVRSVRRRFKGFVTYQANWGGEETSVMWWDALDAISISAYYPVAASEGLGVRQLAAGWRSFVDRHGQERRWFERIEELRRRWRRPVMFGEIGYRPVPATAIEPWNINLPGSDRLAQPRAYKAALRVWYRVRWFRGMHWWYVAPHAEALDGHVGADHRPGRAALRALRRWYGRAR